MVASIEDGTVVGYEHGDASPAWTVNAVPGQRLYGVCQARCPDAALFAVPQHPSQARPDTFAILWITEGRETRLPATQDGVSYQVLAADSPEDYLLATHLPDEEETTLTSVDAGGVDQVTVAGALARYVESPSGKFALVRVGDTLSTSGSLVWVEPEFNPTPQPPPAPGSGAASACLADDGRGLLLNDSDVRSIEFPQLSDGPAVDSLAGGQSQCMLFDEGRRVVGSIFSEGETLRSVFEDYQPSRGTMTFEDDGFSSISASPRGELVCLSGLNGARCWRPDGTIVFSSLTHVQAVPVGSARLALMSADGELTWQQIDVAA